MEIGIVTDSFAHLPFERMLDTAAGLGLTAVELPTGVPVRIGQTTLELRP